MTVNNQKHGTHQDGQWQIVIPVSHYEPDDEYTMKAIRREKARYFGEWANDQLWHERWWAVRITEHQPSQAELDWYRENLHYPDTHVPQYKIRIDLKEIQREDYRMPSLGPDYPTWSNKRVATSAINELKYRLKRWIKR